VDRIIRGDCLDALPDIPAHSIDLIVTDPPYFRVKNLPWDRQWDSATGFLAWLDRVLAEFQRVLKPNGSAYVFASPRMAARVEVLMSEGLNVLNRIRWTKDAGWHRKTRPQDLRSYLSPWEEIIFAEPYGANGGYANADDRLRAGVYEPIRAHLEAERDAAGLTNRDVDAILGTNGMAGHYFGSSQWALPTPDAYEKLRASTTAFRREYEDLRREYEDLRREYEDLRRPFTVTPDVPYTDVWTFRTVTHYRGKHACEKPQALLRHIIQTSSRPGDLVLDAFAGSGSTLQAARDLGRQYIGIEMDPEWAAKAEQRVRAAQPLAFAAD